jgi:glycerate kinase
MPRLLAAPDKFRGTASATDVAHAMRRAAKRAGWQADAVPMADGGEGILEALGGTVRRTRVRGPLGETVLAEWRLKGSTAVIEMAQAAGLGLAGGPEWNDPMRASTAGVGDLISAALAAGAKRIVVGVGGSASTDGGLGCLSALEPHARLTGVELIVACDVTTRFVDAAEDFAPQKGATPAQVALLGRRLERLAQVYEEDHGIDVRDIPGSGAAGGLAGGLAAVGATLMPGFDLVADTVGLVEKAEGADLLVTGEGFLDEQSFRGKVVGGVIEVGADLGVPVLVVVGEVFGDHAEHHDHDVEVVSLVERFGPDRALADTTACIEEVVGECLRLRPGGGTA